MRGGKNSAMHNNELKGKIVVKKTDVREEQRKSET